MAQDFSFIPLEQLHPNWQQIIAPKQQQVAPKPKYGGLAGALINNLPAIAGGIGMVGGEVLDPFGGGLLTGSLASGAGEALKQKLLGQSLSPKQIAIQAGETAALGGIGKGFTAARASSKALLGAGAADMADTTGSKVGNFLVNKGNQEAASLGGYAVGQKVGGDKLGTAASEKIAQTLADQGISGVSAKTAQAQIEARLAQLNQARDSLYSVHNAPLAPEDVNSVKSAVNDLLSKTAGGTTPTVKNLAKTYAGEALSQGDLSGLAQYKTSLDNNLINWNRNPASVEPGSQVAAGVVRNAISKVLKDKVPGLAQIDTPYSQLSTANEALKTAAGRTANLSTSGGGLWGRILGGETAENAKGVYAKGLQKVGKAMGGATPNATPATDLASTLANGASGIKSNVLGRTVAPILGKPGATALSVGKQAAGRGISNALLMGGGSQQPIDPSTALSDASAAPQTDLSQSGDSSMITPDAYKQAVLADLAQTGGKHLPVLESLYKQFGPQAAPALDANQQKEVSASVAAIGRIQQYGQQLDTLTKGANGNVASGTLATALGKYDPFANASQKQAAALQSSRRDVAIQLATALMGGNKPSAQSVDEIEASLPSVNDSPQLRQNKLNAILSGLHENLRNYATPVSQITQSLGYGKTTNGDVGSQLSSVLAGLSQ